MPPIPASRVFRALAATALALSASAAPDAQAPDDVVIHAADAVDVRGEWQKIADNDAAGGARLWHPDAGAPKITTASASPAHYFDLQFHAESGRAYRLWLRAKAERSYWGNDSVFVQFSGSVDASGAAVYRIGTTSAATVVREDCSGCAFSGWGWQDNEYGNLALGPEIRFAHSGAQTMRIQAREDGVAIDQIVLSSATWFTTPPGAKDDDHTVHPATVTIEPPPAGGNRPPAASAWVSLDGVWPYERQFQNMPDPDTYMFSDSTDPDGDTLVCEWKNAAGEVIATQCGWDTTVATLPPGTHGITLTVRDGRGGESSTTVSVSVANYEEIVIVGSGYKELVVGTEWERFEDADGVYPVVRDRNAGAPKATAPLASPASYVSYGFVADPTLEYKLWIRLKAENGYWGNDSVWVQFSGAVDADGRPVFREGTTSGLAVNLEECAGCGISGWGWRDDAWGSPGVMSSTYVRFPAGGVQELTIQTREDGASIDTIVLSARKYKTTRPGAVKNDATRLGFTAEFGS